MKIGFIGLGNMATAMIGGDKKVIICHLGNGSSLSAVKDGKCMDTTMDFRTQKGLYCIDIGLD